MNKTQSVAFDIFDVQKSEGQESCWDTNCKTWKIVKSMMAYREQILLGLFLDWYPII